MLHPPFRKSPLRARQGSALIIILAFVVLLTGLIVAFFSRSLSERQISNSSAGQTKVELFAHGAVDTIVGDLKQEIAAGSIATTLSPAPIFGGTLYTPKIATTTVPALVGSSGANGLQNLVKRSVYQQPFYVGTNYDPNYSASNRAANLPSTSISQNGRVITLPRWNSPLLLPKQTPASDTDLTPIAGATGYTPPDWILVARDGSNPTIWGAGLNNAAATSFVLGRYAYNIYDEGGLLDMNAAGYASTVTSTQSGSKTALSFADLTQLQDSSSNPLLTPAQIDTFIGWRNYASTQAPGAFPTPAFTAASGLNYFHSILSNTTGFLKTSNIALYNSQSDQMLASRQHLINLLLRGIATTSAERANLQNALQYLGTFSRSLSQPSFVRAQALDSTAPGYDSQAPKILDVAKGGNEGSTGDTKLNPPFLTVRVGGTSWKRNDNSTPVIGEPLVKKRFALSRLAWLTYKGPIADDSGNLSADPGIQSIITGLTNTYGVSNASLKQGGPANITKYFGLSWDTANNRWKYIHGKNGTSGPIMTLSQVAALNTREPDFFEILKAAMCAGSLAKTYMYSAAIPTDPYWLTPTGYQEERDSSIDAHVIQIGANIIDQFDLDGYPTRINFDDGSLFGSHSGQQEYRGVEDLPYVYRVREGKIMIRDSVPAQYNLPSVGAAPGNFSAGIGVVVQEPEIWNPHAWSTTASDTYPRPTSFQLTATSSDPNNVTPAAQTTLQPVAQWRYASGGTASSPVSLSSSPAAVNASLQFQIPQSPSRRDLFREPTLLLKSNVPAGCSLSGGTSVRSLYSAAQYAENGVSDTQQYLCILLGTVPMAWQTQVPAGGIDGTLPATATSGIVPAGFAYYPTTVNGITYRLQYKDASGSWATYDEKYAGVANAGSYNNWPGEAPPSYNQKTFNRKANNAYANCIVGCEISAVCFDPRTSRFGMSVAGTNGRGGNSLTFPLGAGDDNRFGDQTSGAAPYFDQGWAAPIGSGQSSAAVQAAAAQNALLTSRPDEYRGFCFSTYDGASNYFGYNTGPTANTGAPSNWSNTTLGGWYPSNSLLVTSPSYGTPSLMFPGMFSQNDPATSSSTSNSRFANDPQTPPTKGTYSNPVSWASTPEPYDFTKQYFADADGVVRRAMSAYVPSGNGNQSPATAPAPGAPSGLPMKPATSYSGGVGKPNTTTNEYASRPIVLNRPCLSVADLGYVFSGTPWRNLDMNTPESAATALLDAFCVNDTDDENGLVAGRVNLNTRQAPVLQAILSGTGKDEFNVGSSTLAAPLSSATAASVSKALISRTTSSTTGMGPMANMSDLVGKWNSSVAVDSSVNGGKSYIGFSSDTANNNNDLTSVLSSGFPTEQRVARFRETSIRALASAGQTRVWNLMIDLVAQTGRYPQNAKSLDQFLVEGEQRCWIHVAIDRYTGEVIDKQIEIVKE